jgi:hypothetical protein
MPVDKLVLLGVDRGCMPWSAMLGLCVCERQEPARSGAVFRSKPRDGGQDVPVLAASGLHADEAGGQAEAGAAAAAGERRDPRGGWDGVCEAAVYGEADR